METITKINENEIEVINTETKMIMKQFSYEYLISQKESIQAQKDRDNAQRDMELAEINNLLAECLKLGITAKSL